MPEQQLVEIAKAIGSAARVLIMDEPTASLSEPEVERLFEVVARLRSEKVGIIYISHRLEEILSIADRVTVLRDGSTVGTYARDGLQRPALINLMIGRELSAIFPKRSVSRSERSRSSCAASPARRRRTGCVARGSQRRNRRARRARRIGPHRAGADGVRPDARRLGRSARARPCRSTCDRRAAPSTPASAIFRKIGNSTGSSRKWRSTRT